MPDSALEAMFSGRHAIHLVDDCVFIDRDPKYFKLMIDYLRNNQKYPNLSDTDYELFELELDYWQIKPIESTIEKLRKIFKSPPKY